MCKMQNSAISLVIRRIFFLCALIIILSVASCTAETGSPEPLVKARDNDKETQSLQEQLRNSPDFKPVPLHQGVDSLVVYKSKRLMYAWHKGKS